MQLNSTERTARTAAPLRGLYALTDNILTPGDRMLRSVDDAISGGAALIQYRDKGSSPEQRIRQASALVELCRKRNVPLIINDDVELTLRVGADGVHLGKDDASIEHARTILGTQAIVGYSCYNAYERALAAQEAGADYVAFGSFFSSATKPNAVRADLDLLRKTRNELSVPVVAIGGITPDNAAELIAAGASMIAVINGVFGPSNTRLAAERYARLFAVGT
jgi:thiamine-phosphate pyrophosphorylase